MYKVDANCKPSVSGRFNQPAVVVPPAKIAIYCFTLVYRLSIFMFMLNEVNIDIAGGLTL